MSCLLLRTPHKTCSDPLAERRSSWSEEVLFAARSCPLSLLLAGILLCLAHAASAAEQSPAPLPDGMVLIAPVVSSEIPDGLRELHERLSAGISPRENAAVWLLHLYGDAALDEPLHDVTLELLGIEKMSPASPLFVSVEEYVKSLSDVRPEAVAETAGQVELQLISAAQERWSAEKFPQLTGYLKANEASLETLVTASKCSGYFAPLLAAELPSRLLSASLVIERRIPYLSRMLSARALLRSETGDLAGCLSDLAACHRLAVLLANGSPFDVSVAKGQVIDSIAFQAERALLESGSLSLDDLQAFQKSVAAYPEFPAAWKAADRGERAIIQQEVELLKTDPESRVGFFENSEHEEPDAAQQKSLDLIDWNLARQEANKVQDRVVAALKIQDHTTQLARFRELDKAYADWEANADAKTAKFSAELKKDLPGMSRWVGENMAMSLRPNYYQRRASDDRLNVRRTLIKTGIALKLYHQEHGEFPAALTDLVPQYLPQPPVDACTDAPLVYSRQDEKEARLMSLGTNRVDDAGKNYNDDVELKLH